MNGRHRNTAELELGPVFTGDAFLLFSPPEDSSIGATGGPGSTGTPATTTDFRWTVASIDSPNDHRRVTSGAEPADSGHWEGGGSSSVLVRLALGPIRSAKQETSTIWFEVSCSMWRRPPVGGAHPGL
jgi:hypothetical protein